MSDSIVLYNKKTIFQKLRPVFSIAGGFLIFLSVLGIVGCVARSRNRDRKEAEITQQIQQKAYDTARTQITYYQQQGALSGKQVRHLQEMLAITPLREKLDHALASYDFTLADTCFQQVQQNPHISTQKKADLEAKIKRINPSLFSQRIEKWYEYSTRNASASKEVLFRMHSELVEDMLGVTIHSQTNHYVNGMLVNFLLTDDPLRYVVPDLKEMNYNLSFLQTFAFACTNFTPPIEQYQSYVHTFQNALSVERRPNAYAPADYYYAASAISKLFEIQHKWNFPKEKVQLLDSSLLDSYQHVTRKAIEAHAPDYSAIAVGLLKTADQYHLQLAERNFYLPFLPSEVSQAERDKQYTSVYTNMQNTISYIHENLIPNKRYEEAYQKVLQGRRMLMQQGTLREEYKMLMHEFEHLGEELTILIRP